MKIIYTLVLMLLASISKGQYTIEWDTIYKLQASDFQSTATQIGQTNVYSVQTGGRMDFSFYMSHAEFMFTKNFNDKVNCIFLRDAAALVAPDSSYIPDLVHFAQYQFDLLELYSRKFRKRLYDEKGAFSDVSFFKPIYDDLQREFSERNTTAGKLSDLGRNQEKLNELHKAVLIEIANLYDFCKDCKTAEKEEIN